MANRKAIYKGTKFEPSSMASICYGMVQDKGVDTDKPTTYLEWMVDNLQSLCLVYTIQVIDIIILEKMYKVMPEDILDVYNKIYEYVKEGRIINDKANDNNN